jgi:hypothetical protein
MNKRTLSVAAILGMGAIAAGIVLTRRLARRSGATAAEVYRALPGDDLVPHPHIETTRAITIHAPVADVWPWIVQVGYHRGGWYTDARLDKLIWHIENPSADRILPEFQQVKVGDTVPDGPTGTARFTVREIVPYQVLTLLDDAGTHIPHTQFSWVFVLREVDAETTRLLLRTRATYPLRWWTTPLAYLALGPADFLMAHVMMLRGIKQRAERKGQRHGRRPMAADRLRDSGVADGALRNAANEKSASVASS